MLKKSYRLKKNEEFQKIYKSGRSYATKGIVLYIDNNEDDQIKIGFSVSKKIGKAHTRNLIKRRMRACMEKNINHTEKSRNFIFLARKPIVEFSYSQIERDMIYLLKKSGGWNEGSTEENNA